MMEVPPEEKDALLFFSSLSCSVAVQEHGVGALVGDGRPSLEAAHPTISLDPPASKPLPIRHVDRPRNRVGPTMHPRASLSKRVCRVSLFFLVNTTLDFRCCNMPSRMAFWGVLHPTCRKAVKGVQMKGGGDATASVAPLPQRIL